MNPVAGRLLVRGIGSRWWTSVVALFIILALALLLLARLGDMEAASERVVLELTLRSMQTGMLIARGEEEIEGRPHVASAWVGANPIAWLDKPPPGYLGACPPGEVFALPQGAWCFDGRHGELRYRLRQRLGAEIFAASAPSVLRWKVVAVLPGNGARIESLTPIYRPEG